MSSDTDLTDALAQATEGLSVTLDEIRVALSPEDLEDLEAGRLDADTLRAFARALVDTRAREGGQVPDGWTQPAHCQACGPVWLWPGAGPEILGCPWCLNRAAGLPVTRPTYQEQERQAKEAQG